MSNILLGLVADALKQRAVEIHDNKDKMRQRTANEAMSDALVEVSLIIRQVLGEAAARVTTPTSDRLHGTCPTCDSPHPSRHPAMAYEGEVELCKDPFHRSTEDGRRTLRDAGVVVPSLEAEDLLAAGKIDGWGVIRETATPTDLVSMSIPELLEFAFDHLDACVKAAPGNDEAQKQALMTMSALMQLQSRRKNRTT